MAPRGKNMSATLSSLFVFYQFSTGRRLFAMQELQKAAQIQGLPALAVFCTTAIDHDRTTRILEARWAGRKTGAHYAPITKNIDGQIDTALTALHDGLDNEAKNSSPQDPLAARAEIARSLLFPKGVAAITSLNYVDELTEVERILHTAKSPEWAPVLRDLGLQRRLDRLETLESLYRTAIADAGDQIAFGEVKSARQRGQSLMLQAIAIILGHCPSDSESDIEKRSQLLAPILRQNEAIREDLRARRPVSDIDPDTGEPEIPPTPTQDAPASP